MSSKALLIALFLSLLFFRNAIGQTTAQPSATSQSTLVQPLKAGPELEKKALDLVEDVITEAQGFKNVENRIRVNTQAANLLWVKNEKRARSLFRQALNSLVEMLSGVDPSDPAYMEQARSISQLRQELVQTVAFRDASLGREFMRLTRSTISDDGPYGEYAESQLEIGLATSAANSDPKQALEIANQMLAKDFPQEVMNVLASLRERDQEAARKLASIIVTKLKTEDLGANYKAMNLAVSLLTEATAIPEADAKQAKTSVKDEKKPLLEESALRELSEALAAGVNNLPAENLYFVQMVEPLLPQIEKYAPGRVQQLRRKIEQANAEMMKNNPWLKYQELTEKGTVESLLEAAPRAPEEMRLTLYQSAAQKAAEAGDLERARQIINDNIKNPFQRSQVLTTIENYVITNAAEQGKVDQARRMLGRLRTNEERVDVLVGLAMSAAQKGDKKLALELLSEAREMSSARARNFTQLNAQLQVARGYARLDPERSFAILDPAIDQLNELLGASIVLGGFVTDDFVKNDELLLEPLTYFTNPLTSQYGVELATLTRSDFDRAKAAADRFQRVEARIMMRLAVAQSVLIEPTETTVTTTQRAQFLAPGPAGDGEP